MLFLIGQNKNSLKIYRKDRRKNKSVKFYKKGANTFDKDNQARVRARN